MSAQLHAVAEPVKRTAASRMLAVFDAFARGGGALSLSEISRYADLSLTTAHRLTKEMLEWGGIEIDQAGRYRLSRKILDLASASTRALQLRERALPHLAELYRRTRLTVLLGVQDGDDVVYLEALRPHPNYTGENRIGGKLALHMTATGLVLLAHAGPGVIEDYLDQPLRRFTPKTPSEPAQLRQLLSGIVRSGYAVAEGYLADEAGSVAAPIANPDGTVTTSVGLVYSLGSVDPAPLADLARVTARRIGDALVDRDAPPDPRTITYNRRKVGLA